MPGIVSFFQNDVPAAFNEVKDPQLLAEFKQSNDGVIAALEEIPGFLKSDLLPRSKGDFRIGAENYRKKLLYDEMVDIPLDRLLADRLRRPASQSGGVQASRRSRSIRTRRRRQILEEMEKDHPARGQLLQAFATMLGGMRQFIVDKQIVTIPSPVPPIVEETPPFMRALTFASMDTPGPYEKVAKEAFFNVTLPDRDGREAGATSIIWGLQSRHDHQHCDPRGLPGTLRAVPVGAAAPSKFASCWGADRMPRAGRTTASR